MPASLLRLHASPWGIEGVQYLNIQPSTNFLDKVSSINLQRFEAPLGDSRHLTVREARTILVGMRIRRDPSHSRCSVSIQFDSLCALLAADKGASPSRDLNLILQEIALENAEPGSKIQCSTRHPHFQALQTLPDLASAAINSKPTSRRQQFFDTALQQLAGTGSHAALVPDVLQEEGRTSSVPIHARGRTTALSLAATPGGPEAAAQGLEDAAYTSSSRTAARAQTSLWERFAKAWGSATHSH